MPFMIKTSQALTPTFILFVKFVQEANLKKKKNISSVSYREEACLKTQQ